MKRSPESDDDVLSPGRRRLIQGLSLVVGATATAGALKYFGMFDRLFPDASVKNPVLAGQAAQRLIEWNKELVDAPERLGEYYPQIAQLATGYVETHMTPLFPHHRDKYQREKLLPRIVFVGQSGFEKIIADCDRYAERKLATALSEKDDKVYVNTDYQFGAAANVAGHAFVTVARESLRLACPQRKDVVVFDKEPDTKGTLPSVRGLTMVVNSSEQIKKETGCGTTVLFDEINSLVIEDAVDRMLNPIGFTGSLYGKQRLDLYYDKMVNPFFKGKWQDILVIQQDSDPIEFFRRLGERSGIKTTDAQVRIGFDIAQAFEYVFLREMEKLRPARA